MSPIVIKTQTNLEELIKEQIQDKVLECIITANEKLNENFEFPDVLFNIKGCVAGRANYHHWQVSFNLQLAKDNLENFLSNTVSHEIAHLISYKKYGLAGKGHGRYWKRVMFSVFGLEPSRCHDYDVSQVKRKYDTYHYSCKCSGYHVIKANLHKKIQNGQSRRCVRCLTKIEFVKYIGKT